MAYLKQIVNRIESEFQLHVHGAVLEDEIIENIQFLTGDGNECFCPQGETLYIGDYRDCCDGDMEGTVILLNCKTLDVGDFVLHIYQDLNPFLLCNCIQDELQKGRRLKLKKEELFYVLQAGYGIQSILDTARSFFVNPITVCSLSFSILAVSPKEDLNHNFESDKDKYYLKKQSLKQMHMQNVPVRLFQQKKPFITQFPEEPELDYLFCGIYLKRTAIGYICIRASVRPILDDDKVFIRDLSDMLSIEMQKDDFFRQKTGLKYEYFLTDLLESKINHEDFAKKRFEQLGQPFGHYFWVISFSFTGAWEERLGSEYYIRQLALILPGGMSFYYNNNLIMLVTGEQRNPFHLSNEQKLIHFLQLNQMQAFVSYRFERILEAPVFYRQTLFLLKQYDSSSHSRIHFYHDYYLKHLFTKCRGNHFISSFVHPDIAELTAFDQTNHTDYIHTLRTYLAHNRNAPKTAKALHIHKSTFFYRLGKMEELLQIQLEDPNMLFAYEISFAILDYIKNIGFEG